MEHKMENDEKPISFNHFSVMLNETVDGLNVKPDGIYVDCTLGGGGHAEKVLGMLGEKGRYIGIDQDATAIKAASKRLEKFGDRFTAVRSNYEDIKKVAENLGIEKVDGILIDLGVSSYQLDTPERGFSYKLEAPLDMRMDSRMETTAYTIVNTYPEMELYRIIRDYGEDRFAKNIAKHIVTARTKKPIETTTELAEIIKGAIPAKMRAGKGHPAKQTFQAIRIELNRELEVLENTLDDMVGLLKPGGRLCIITFHSLEDRIVKSSFRRYENPCTCPPSFPVCTCGKKSKGRVVTRKPILPGEEELEKNSRSKSAKLRIFERGDNEEK
jgi:16S rRNA (cytosine1402-N4)-methyltransferase